MHVFGIHAMVFLLLVILLARFIVLLLVIYYPVFTLGGDGSLPSLSLVGVFEAACITMCGCESASPTSMLANLASFLLGCQSTRHQQYDNKEKDEKLETPMSLIGQKNVLKFRITATQFKIA